MGDELHTRKGGVKRTPTRIALAWELVRFKRLRVTILPVDKSGDAREE
jgi:hypothetical protein